jgi:hypothetical protein
MDGGIYSAQGKCACGGRFRDTGKGLFCEQCGAYCHSLQVKFHKTKKRFTDYQQAKRFLNALRYSVDEGKYDSRDYLYSQPLGFANLSNQWLDRRANDGTRCIRNLRCGKVHAPDVKSCDCTDFVRNELTWEKGSRRGA